MRTRSHSENGTRRPWYARLSSPAGAGRRAVVALAATSALGVTACTGPLVVEPAPYAADPQCASVMLSIPDRVGGLEMRSTSSQATAGYGDEPPIVVRCGVEPPGPSEDRCVAIDTASGAQDWLIRETEEDWVAVSFGRSPAVEVTIPKLRADEAVAELLGDLSGAASLADPNGLECR